MAEHIEVFNHPHNWSTPLVENYEFKTDIVTSQSGREQRRSLRRVPRFAVETRINAVGAELIKLRRQLTLWGQYPFWQPDWVRWAPVASAVSVGVSTLPTSWALPGAKVGMKVIIDMPSGSSPTYTLIGATATQLQLNGPILETVPAGTRVHLAYQGYIPSGQQSQLITDRVSTMVNRFEADPSETMATEAGTAAQTFTGIEVVTLRPNWQSSVDLSHDYEIYDVDFGRGIKKRYHPVSYNRPTTKWMMRNMDADRSIAVLQFFLRMKGRLRVCYVPSFLDDLPPTATLAKNSDKFKVAGLEAMQYWDQAVQRAIRIEGVDGTVWYRRVLSMTQATADTEVRVDTPWPLALAVKQISWMTRSRLASDLLVLSWLTDTVSECDLSFTLLEDPQ